MPQLLSTDPAAGLPPAAPPGALLSTDPSAGQPAGGGPEMTFAIVNGVRVPLGGDEADYITPEEPPGNIARFGTRLAENAKGIKDTLPIPQAIGGAGVAQGPVNALGGLIASHFDQGVKAYDSFKEGDYTSAALHGVAALVPGVGPMVANAAEEATAGHWPEAIADAVTIGAVPKIAEAAKGMPAAARRISANRATARAARQSVNAVLPDLMKAAPPTKTASWNTGDWQRAGKYIVDEHSTAPINSVETLRDAAEAAVTKIEDHVKAGVDTNPKDLIRVNPIDRVTDAFKGRARSDDLALGLAELKSLGLDQPMTLVDAENARKRLNAENTATLRKNHIDRYTARTEDPKFAAREVAAEALRDGIYDQLEARGMKDVRELRRDEGAILRIRNAVERQIYGGEKTVAGTGKDSPARRVAAKASTVLGGAAGAATGGPIGAAVGAGVGHEIGGMFSRPNLTRDAMIERAFKNAVGPGVTLPPLPVAPPIAGHIGAGATPLPSVPNPATMTVTQVPWSAYPPSNQRGLPPYKAPILTTPPPDRSVVRGVPAEYARSVRPGLPAIGETSEPNKPPIRLPAPSYIEGEYVERRPAEAATGPIAGRADVERADLSQQGVLEGSKRPNGAETRRLEAERDAEAKRQYRKEVNARADAFDDIDPTEITPHEVTIESIVEHAQKNGYSGDPSRLRSELDERVQVIKEMDAELSSSGRNPEVLLREIAKFGGLSIKNESGLKGELKWLQQAQDTPARGIPRGTMRGIRGVIKDSGLSVDDMLTRLRQDPRFEHIRNLNDLIAEVRGAATARGDHASILERLRKGLGDRWWERIGAGVEDISFEEP